MRGRRRIEAEQRLVGEGWSLFDGHHVLMRPGRMTPLELQLSDFRALLRSYARRAIARPELSAVLRHLL